MMEADYDLHLRKVGHIIAIIFLVTLVYFYFRSTETIICICIVAKSSPWISSKWILHWRWFILWHSCPSHSSRNFEWL